MPVAKALDKKWLQREIERDHRRKAREKLAELRRQLRDARAQRKESMKNAKERCRSERLAARERARALRIRGLAELREAARLERQNARDACVVGKTEAKSKEGLERRRAELEAEQAYQAEMRRIEQANRTRRREHPHATHIERRAESDDEVRSNIPQNLVPLFERVKRGIKGSPRMSRTEAFLHYAEENPDEVFDVIEEGAAAMIRDLERQEAKAARALRRPPRRQALRPPEHVAEVPF
jgi:hypothetical protein